MAFSANLNVMMKTARKVGRQLLKDFTEVEQLQVSTKGPGDFVSRADRRAEETIRSELMTARPSYGFLGEEGGGQDGEDPTRRWIVDPLDGTTNFLHGLPHWAVSIALEHKGNIVAGVIHDPVKDEMFHAERGEGAWLNGSRIRVSGRRRMVESLFATGVPFAAMTSLPAVLRDLSRLMPECAGVRRLGAASLDMAYVAAGRYEGYWEREIHPWDIAAGMIIVAEAGGFVGPVLAEGDPLAGGGIIAGNATLHDRLTRVIRAGG